MSRVGVTDRTTSRYPQRAPIAATGRPLTFVADAEEAWRVVAPVLQSWADG